MPRAQSTRRSYLPAAWVAMAFVLISPVSVRGGSEKPAELPARVTQLIDTLFAAPAFDTAKLSPDGSHFAYIHEVNGLKVFETYEFKTGSIRRLAGASGVNRQSQFNLDQNITEFSWLGPNQLVLFANEGNEYYSGLWVTDGNLKNCQQLRTQDKALFVTDPLPQSAEAALLNEASRNNFYGPLWRLDKKSLTIYEGERNPGRVIGWQADVAGLVRLATVADPGGGWSYLYRDTEKQPWQPLVLPPRAEVVTFDVTGRNLLLSLPGAEGRSELRNFALDTKTLEERSISDPVYDVEPDVVTDDRTGVPVGLRYEADKPVTLWLHPQYAQLAKLFEKSFPQHVVSSIGAIDDGDILFGVSADIDPLAYYRYDSRKQTIKPVMASLPGAAKLKAASMQPVAFDSRDGAKLHGYLTMPADRAPGQKLPLVALCHGGPHARDLWGFDPEVQFLAALGYAVLQVNYRGSAGLGRPHALRNTIEVAEKSVDDVVDGIRWAIAQGSADPHRIVAYGASYGGYISLGLATRYPDLLAAAVGFAGVYDWEEHYRQLTNPWINPRNLGRLFEWRSDYYLDPRKNADRYRAVSPVHFADKVRCAVLLHHGRSDETVEISQTNGMARALRDAGKSVEVIKDPEGVHGLASEQQSKAFYRGLAAFLLKHAPPD